MYSKFCSGLSTVSETLKAIFSPVVVFYHRNSSIPLCLRLLSEAVNSKSMVSGKSKEQPEIANHLTIVLW